MNIGLPNKEHSYNLKQNNTQSLENQYNQLNQNPAGDRKIYKAIQEEIVKQVTDKTNLDNGLGGKDKISAEANIKERDAYVIRGTFGRDVDKIVARGQASLVRADYQIESKGSYKGVNGIQCEATTRALNEFQKDVGLKSSSKFDQESMKTLDLVTAAGLKKADLQEINKKVLQSQAQESISSNEPKVEPISYQELTPEAQGRLTERDAKATMVEFGKTRGNYQMAQAQASLEMIGYQIGEIDGTRNVQTIESIKQFQQDVGLPVTGKLDPDTYYMLERKTVEGWVQPNALKRETKIKDTNINNGRESLGQSLEAPKYKKSTVTQDKNGNIIEEKRMYDKYNEHIYYRSDGSVVTKRFDLTTNKLIGEIEYDKDGNKIYEATFKYSRFSDERGTGELVTAYYHIININDSIVREIKEENETKFYDQNKRVEERVNRWVYAPNGIELSHLYKSTRTHQGKDGVYRTFINGTFDIRVNEYSKFYTARLLSNDAKENLFQSTIEEIRDGVTSLFVPKPISVEIGLIGADAALSAYERAQYNGFQTYEPGYHIVADLDLSGPDEFRFTTYSGTVKAYLPDPNNNQERKLIYTDDYSNFLNLPNRYSVNRTYHIPLK